MNIRIGLGTIGGDPGPTVTKEGDSMVIDCRGCRLTPVPGSDECIRCMVSAMCANGSSDRVVLRTGRDIEVSGDAGRAIREVASIRRWSSDTARGGPRCRGCRVSRDSVMTAAWNGFPRTAVFEGKRVLRNGPPDRDECRACVMRTSKALEQMDAGIRRVISEMDIHGEANR